MNSTTSPYPVGTHDQWDDNYGAELFATFEELSEAFSIAEGDFAHLNVPVWLITDAENEAEWDIGSTLTIGMFQPRHGRCWQLVGPATPEQMREIEERVLRVWAGRAEACFDKYNGKYRKVVDDD